MRFAPISAVFAMVVACTNETAPINDGRAADQAPAPAAGTPENSGNTTAPPPPAAPARMTFFITSTGSGALGGNLGGLAGADKRCQDLAGAVNAGDRTWHAYLSAEGVNAKDRIGPGPWQNQKGVVIATSLAALHDDFFNPQDMDMIDEKGAAIPPTGRYILTGTKRDGTALLDTCQNWTSNTNGRTARIGDSASRSSSLLAARWNDNAASYGCSEATLKANKVEGRLYCFSVEP
jgi:hypothetical protein